MNVRSIRAGMGMTQTEFAATFGFAVGTLRNWEQGIRRPHGSARVLLIVIKHRPDVVMRVLAADLGDGRGSPTNT